MKPGIALLHFNKIRLTRRCLDSLLSSDVEPERIVCLDNGSQDTVTSELRKEYTQVQHIKLRDNKGFSGGFNAAVQAVFKAGFNPCVFLTNDTVFRTGADILLADALRNNKAGLAAPSIRYLSNPDNIDSIGAFFSPETASLGHYHDRDLPVVLNPGVDYIPGTALAITRDAYQVLNGVDEGFHTYWEDVDLSFRAAEADIRMIRCYESLIEHGVGQTCHKKPFYTTYLFQRNRLLFCKKHLRGAQLKTAIQIISKDWQAMYHDKRSKGDQRRTEFLVDLLSLL